MTIPLTLDQVRDAWNAKADSHNQWDALGFDEMIEFAQELALAAVPSPPSGWLPINCEPVEWQFRTVPPDPPPGMDVDQWYPWVRADDKDHWESMRKMFAGNANAQFRALCVIPATEDCANG